ncbi:MAG TPA: 50S ribosomal protein L6 [Candidatus Syntrophoarchaeum butanivorans]|uniref:Large ribosomal subunit protein uL6 n=1 Tax=Candidatus Syntropharchaeum butanivorans TaxID=1839936 RepID=A0A1F2P465_9EURY|nr:MAG: Ribosomal protein L6P, archaea [Candidatus Syntrophoarchaeum butanivorans]RJS70630.1 MAG: 50S ribosomal protein L6 [Candidatus Syntrophoarchaeum sp. WYZ-LMO15]HDM36442.1 50S ribosomal protein L6 [Candidatus Syntrophoarchaeum butanivorans]HEC57308.1 50S ribosomal protein L6 [Candidatus Syntrophoarchaeum butanivorans]
MFTKEIPIPDGVDVVIEGRTVTVAKDGTRLTRELWHPAITIRRSDNHIEVSTGSPRKKVQALTGTFAAHIRNMIEGVTKGFEYRMKVVYAHFPIQLRVEGDHLVIENFLGERAPRRARIMEGASVRIDGSELIITGADKEAVGQTAGNIEQATRIKRRDPRVFQDGIYIISKSVGGSS